MTFADAEHPDSIRGAVADLRSPEGADRNMILGRLQRRLDELTGARAIC